MADLSLAALVFCFVAVFVGSAVQTTIGIGLGLLAAPLLALVDPDFVPGTIVLLVLPLSGGLIWGERASIDWPGLKSALIGRVPGVVAGSLLAARLSSTLLALSVAFVVLLAVAASVRGWRVRMNSPTLIGAGFTSGLMGTATGVGGPPMAITYQHGDAATMRSTLSLFFAIGVTLSAVGLILTGEIGARQWQLAGLMLPAVLLALVVGRQVRGRLAAERVRPFVLAVCSVSALVLLVETLAG